MFALGSWDLASLRTQRVPSAPPAGRTAVHQFASWAKT